MNIVRKYYSRKYSGRKYSSHIHGLCCAAFVALSLAASGASASIITYSGSDDGALVTHPFTESDAAKASFEAVASGLGTLTTITFEGLDTGFNSVFVAAPGVSVALTGLNYGNGFTGISDYSIGNLYGFNTTASGSKWLGFPEATATFSFTNPIEAFGFYLTGLQNGSGVSGSKVNVLVNGETLFAPINTIGGVSWFGFTSTNPFSSITISNFSNDAWGIDDVMFTSARVATVPEPTILLLFGLGLAGIATSRRRRRS
jgi:hypothetical protein